MRYTIRTHARLLAQSFAANLASALEYRANFALQVLGMMANNAAFALFWKILLDRTGALGGYGHGDIMYIWSLSSAAFGLAHVLFGGVSHIARMVKEGDLDTYLLQPKDVWFHVLVSRSDPSAWGDILYGVLVAVLLGLNPGQLALWAFFVVTGSLLIASTFALGESLSLFVGGSEGLGHAVAELLLNFSLYPESIFPKAMRWIFYSLIPSGFVVFLPRTQWISPAWWIPPAVLAAALAWTAVSWGVFSLGIRRYESGNRIGERI